MEAERLPQTSMAAMALPAAEAEAATEQVLAAWVVAAVAAVAMVGPGDSAAAAAVEFLSADPEVLAAAVAVLTAPEARALSFYVGLRGTKS